MSTPDTDDAATASSAPAGPALRIVSGNPSAEDLAVLTAVLLRRGGDGEQAKPAVRGGWADPARLMRTTIVPGPGRWARTF